MEDVGGVRLQRMRLLKTRVVHCRRAPYDVYIGRPSPWGNPFEIDRDGTRTEVIAKYEQYILATPSLLDKVGALAGKVLGCWCRPRACHGDVLARLADQAAAD